MSYFSMFTIVLAAVALASVAIHFISENRPLRDAYVLHFSLCDTSSSGTLQCVSCFAGNREPLCPEDAMIMMMRPK